MDKSQELKKEAVEQETAVPTAPVPTAVVLTIVDFTGPQPGLKLECEACGVDPARIGARFCSNCGIMLTWENIKIRQPEPPKYPEHSVEEPGGIEEPIDENAKPIN